jgi:peptide/nickel transport system permease protein
VSEQVSDSPLPLAGANAIRDGVRRVLRQPMGLLGLTLVVLIVLGAVFADVLTDYNPVKLSLRDRFAEPSLAHLLGTDQLGRDLFTRVLCGARIALWVALVSTGIGLVGGLVLGMIAGYGPAWLDATLILIFDALRSFPTVMLALALVTLIGPSLGAVVLVVVLANLPSYARIVRAQTMALISMDIPVVITIEAGMSFLGLGVRPPTPSWGSILNDGFAYIRESPWPAIAGGLPIIIATLGFTFLGETLRDEFDPRLRTEA